MKKTPAREATKATKATKARYFVFDPNEDCRSYDSADKLLKGLRKDVNEGLYDTLDELEDLVIVRGVEIRLVVDNTFVLHLEVPL